MRRNNWMHLGVLLLLVLGGGATVTTLLKAETPYGRVTGVLTMAESGIPLAGVRVELDEDTKRDDGHDYVAHTDAQGRFTVEHVAVGTYKLSARTDAHAAPDVTVEVREDTVADASTVLKPVPPFVSLEKLEHVYTTRESIALRVHGFVPEKSLELTLYRFTDKVAAKAWNGWLPAHVATDNGKADLAALAHASSLHRVRTTTVAVTQRDVEGVFRQALTLGTLPAGTYLLAAQAGVVRDTALVAVTDMGMVVKNNGKRLLAYTVSLLTGKAQPDVAVTVQFGDNVVAHRSTDDEGL